VGGDSRTWGELCEKEWGDERDELLNGVVVCEGGKQNTPGHLKRPNAVKEERGEALRLLKGD